MLHCIINIYFKIMKPKHIKHHLFLSISALILVQAASGQNVGIGLPADAARAQLEIVGAGGLRVSTTNTGAGTTDWIAGNFGYSPAGDRVVMGNLFSTATLGAHNNTLTAWSPLYINFAGPGGAVNISLSDTTYLGNTVIGSLAGTGTRMVVVNNTGVVSSQSIPVQPVVNGINGLVSPGNTIQLGGTLTQPVSITQNNYSLRFNNAGGGTNLVVVNGRVGINIANPTYSLQVNGTLAGNSAYINLSDQRYKTDIQPIGNAVQKLMHLRGVQFNWKNNMPGFRNPDNQMHTGFIAQEVEQVLPQAVTTADDRLKTKAIAYNELIPVLVEVIKQQQVQTVQLQKQIDDLKRKLQ